MSDLGDGLKLVSVLQFSYSWWVEVKSAWSVLLFGCCCLLSFQYLQHELYITYIIKHSTGSQTFSDYHLRLVSGHAHRAPKNVFTLNWFWYPLLLPYHSSYPYTQAPPQELHTATQEGCYVPLWQPLLWSDSLVLMTVSLSRLSSVTRWKLLGKLR